MSIEDILTDLIKGFGIQEDNIVYDLKVNIEEKIKLNYSEDEIQLANDEYSFFVESGIFTAIAGVLETYDDEEINSFKLRVFTDFNNTAGKFKDKLNILTSHYLNNYSNQSDDDCKRFIRAILIYCFEQCIIGSKTKDEK